MSTDAELHSRAVQGDGAAWSLLLSRHEAFAFGLAKDRMRRAGFGPAEAEEVAQEVWVSLLRSGARFDGEGSLRPYLAVAVLNGARMWLRSGSRRAAREAAWASPDLAPGTPDEPLLRAEEAGQVRYALSRLRPREQILLRWAYWEGLGHAEIARLSGVSPESVASLLHKARMNLRETLEKGEFRSS